MKTPTQSPCRLLLTGLLFLSIMEISHTQTFELPYEQLEKIAQNFGEHLYEISKKATHVEEIKKRYSSAKIVNIDAKKMIKEMASDIEMMLEWKIETVKTITDFVQQSMHEHEFIEDIKFKYYNAKTINENSTAIDSDPLPMILKENQRFSTRVNTTFSSIHVATNVYNQDVSVLNAIEGSEAVNRNFKFNYERDPTSLWQYFGSVTGFLRNYPGIKWIVDEERVDTFDCRMRPWYIEAAASPKDMVILLDTSGSMTGFRFEIAKHVVSALLDTLNSNDYVAVYKFSTETRSAVECFQDLLVTANRENTALFKQSLAGVKIENQANFTKALIIAFELLQKYNDTIGGSQCNQAIMLITDGAPETFENIFNLYNQPYRHVRVFTYLIGREVNQAHELQEMACEHRGYYTHVKTMAEIREQVQKYIPVMARPMIMQEKQTFVWTPVYADFNDIRYCADYPNVHFCENDENTKYFQFMTTVAAPVFDLTNTTTNPNLLGVAGTDVPTAEIIKLTPSYKLGVNGYPFIITNNGHLLSHPDLRPMFHDRTKLDYNTIDLSETEMSNSDVEPWEKDPEIMLLRQKMIDRETDSMNITVRSHYDNMKRVIPRTNLYYIIPVNQTPFSVAIVLPESYGLFRVEADIEDERGFIHAKSTLEDTNWRIHPDWVYCIYRFIEENGNESIENILKQFIDEFKDDIVEKNDMFLRVLSPNFVGAESDRPPSKQEKYYCDFELIRMLLFDANATNVYDKNGDNKEKNGIKVTFVATRSGLTRWQDISEEEIGMEEEMRHFANVYNRAIDEVWYKRAVDQYFVDNTSFVFSVPFYNSKIWDLNEIEVTGSHAIFVEDREQNAKVPVAVVGLQFAFPFFAKTFMSFTSDCHQEDCSFNCSSSDTNCYLLDDNGFVISSKEFEQAGKFFGEVNGIVMRSLIIEGIYEGVQIYDFQGMCEERNYDSAASAIVKPLELIASFFGWIWKKLFVLWIEYNLYNLWNYDWLIFASPFEGSNPGIGTEDNKTYEFYFRSCNKNITLYRLNPQQLTKRQSRADKLECGPSGDDIEWEEKYEEWLSEPKNSSFPHPRPYSIHRVPHSNLVFVAAHATCTSSSFQTVSIEAKEMEFVNDTRCLMMRTTLHRKPPAQCYNYHPDELEIRDCGRGCSLQMSFLLLIFCLIMSSMWT